MRCSACKTEKAEVEFARKGGSRKQDQCKACKKAYNKLHYIEHKEEYLLRAKLSNSQRRAEYRAKLNELKQHPCVDCRKSYPPYVMDFDHLGGKESSVSGAVADQWLWEKILEEVAKCELVCANCHRERTHQRR